MTRAAGRPWRDIGESSGDAGVHLAGRVHARAHSPGEPAGLAGRCGEGGHGEPAQVRLERYVSYMFPKVLEIWWDWLSLEPYVWPLVPMRLRNTRCKPMTHSPVLGGY